MGNSQLDFSSDPASCSVPTRLKINNVLLISILRLSPQFIGRLRKCIDFWRWLEVSQFILNVIIQCYYIPFSFIFPQLTMPLQVTTVLVSEALNDLLQLNLSEEIFFACWTLLICFPFLLTVGVNKEGSMLGWF